MANVLLDIRVELESAAERASAAYQVANHLSQGIASYRSFILYCLELDFLR